MTTIQKIAQHISARAKAQGWKAGTKKADDLNMECWIGAWMALTISGHEDAEWAGRVVTFVIAARGFRETLHIAEQTDPLGAP